MAASVRPVPTVPSELKTFLRSVLVSSNGVRESRVERDYRELAGEKLDWRKLGFKSLREFLCAIPDVCRLQYNTKHKENHVYAVEVKGIYMSSHAKKNAKSASNVGLPQNNTLTAPLKLLSPPGGRRVEQEDGGSLKISFSAEEKWTGIELVPNKSGLYQVYVANLPPQCSKSDLRMLFLQYGDVKEVDIVMSKRNNKIGFVRYTLKQEALQALTEAKTTPPVLKGHSLDVGEAKCKNVNDVETSVNTVLSSETKNGTNMLPPISTQISTSLSPTRSFQRPIPSALSVFKNDAQDKHFSTGDSMTDSAETLNEPSLLFAVNVSGYINQKMNEEDLRTILQNVGHIEQFEYHPLYSIVKFKTRNEAMNALKSMNGTLVNGSVLLVTALIWPVVEPTAKSKPDEVKRNDKVEAKIKLDEAKKDEGKKDEGQKDEMKKDEVKKDEVELKKDKISEIYSLYSEAVISCCGQSYENWLNTLPLIFEVKVMEVLDPCTFWAHLYDGTVTYEHFNDLTTRIQFVDPLSNKKRFGKNEFGIGQFSVDGKWYRCYCYDVSTNGKYLHVMYIDYGNCEWLGQDNVLPLPPAFLQLRPQAVLIRLSGFRWQSNKKSINSPALLCAKQLFMDSDQAFTARKASVDPTKPLLLEVEILQSEGEAIYKKLSCQPDIVVMPRVASPVQHVLLSTPPLSPSNYQPLKNGLVTGRSIALSIWITNITSLTTFYFQMVNDDSRHSIRAIQEYLLQCDVQNKINISDIKGETLVCCHKNGRERSRVQLLSASRHIVPGQVNVLHVDIGKEAMVPCTSFISLPRGADAFPYQARPARLFNVPNNHQAPAALDFIIQQSNKVLRAKVVAENRDESVVLELFDFKGDSINKHVLAMICREYATHAPSYDPGVNVLSKEIPSVSHGTIQPLMIPPQATSQHSTSHQPTPTDIAGVQGNWDGFRNVSPAEKPFHGETAGKDVFPRPSLVSNQNQVSPQSTGNFGRSGQDQHSSTPPLELEPSCQNYVGPVSPSKLGPSSQNQVSPESGLKLEPFSQNQGPPSPSKLGPSSQNQVSPQSGWKLEPFSQNQGPPSLSKLGPRAQNQVGPWSPSKLAPTGPNQVDPRFSSKMGPNTQDQDSSMFPPKSRPNTQDQDSSMLPPKSRPNTQDQVSSMLPPKSRPNTQDQTSSMLPPKSRPNTQDQTSSMLPPKSRPNTQDQTSSMLPPKSRPNTQDQDSSIFPPKSRPNTQDQVSSMLPSKSRPNTQDQDSSIFPPKSRPNTQDQVSSMLPRKSRPNTQDQDSSMLPPKSRPNTQDQDSSIFPPKSRPNTQDQDSSMFPRKSRSNTQDQASSMFPSKFGPNTQDQASSMFPSKFGSSSFVGEPKPNDVSSQVNSGPKKAEQVPKRPTGNAKAGQGDSQKQTSPFTWQQVSLAQSSSPASVKPSQTNPSNQASAFLLKQGTPSSLKSTTMASTVANRAEGSKGFMKSKQQNPNFKPSHDEKQANEKQVPKDLKPVNCSTSGDRKISFPTHVNAQKSVDSSAKGGKWNTDRALARKDERWRYDELMKKIEDQDRVLSRPASEQRQLLAQQKIKDKLEVQVRIKTLENAVFALQNEIQTLNLERNSLEKQLDQE